MKIVFISSGPDLYLCYAHIFRDLFSHNIPQLSFNGNYVLVVLQLHLKLL